RLRRDGDGRAGEGGERATHTEEFGVGGACASPLGPDQKRTVLVALGPEIVCDQARLPLPAIIRRRSRLRASASVACASSLRSRVGASTAAQSTTHAVIVETSKESPYDTTRR